MGKFRSGGNGGHGDVMITVVSTGMEEMGSYLFGRTLEDVRAAFYNGYWCYLTYMGQWLWKRVSILKVVETGMRCISALGSHNPRNVEQTVKLSPGMGSEIVLTALVDFSSDGKGKNATEYLL